MARNAKQKIEAKPAVQQLFTDLLDRAGVTDELLAERIREGLDATVVMRDTKYAGREVLIDFSERREMTQLATQLRGHLVDKHEVRDKTLEDLLEGSHA